MIANVRGQTPARVFQSLCFLSTVVLFSISSNHKNQKRVRTTIREKHDVTLYTRDPIDVNVRRRISFSLSLLMFTFVHQVSGSHDVKL